MSVQLRLATSSDVRRIFYWRNHPKIRLSAIDTSPITWNTHRVWFDKTLKDPNRILLIASNAYCQLGSLRLDRLHQLDHFMELSIFLAPQHLGKGFGLQVLLKGVNWAVRHDPRIKGVNAKVVKLNQASHSLFKKAGFKEAGVWKKGTKSGISYVYKLS